jgi:phenylpropionate dioxygenase-like ring-hydroxylating dioxygenase large terminal subunit
MIVDQSPEGLEVLRGASSYIYEGNWKLTAENGADGYHVSSVHWNYAATQNQRKQREAGDEIKTMSAGGWAKQGGGFYSFDHGHMLLWTRWANPEDRPAYERRDELAADFGQARADWMIENSRNLCLYPNVYLMDQFSSQIRIARPISVNKTEITIYCIAPKGESAEARARASASTRTSSTSAAWPPRTTWKSSAPARPATAAAPAGTTCPAARALGRRCRRGARRSTSTAAVGRAHRGRRPVRAAAQVLAGDHDQGPEGRTATDPRGGRAMTCMTPCATFSTAKRATWTTRNGTSGWSCTPRRDLLDAVLGR